MPFAGAALYAEQAELLLLATVPRTGSARGGGGCPCGAPEGVCDCGGNASPARSQVPCLRIEGLSAVNPLLTALSAALAAMAARPGRKNPTVRLGSGACSRVHACGFRDSAAQDIEDGPCGAMGGSCTRSDAGALEAWRHVARAVGGGAARIAGLGLLRCARAFVYASPPPSPASRLMPPPPPHPA